MTRSIINKLSPVLFALLLFASCDKEEYNMGADAGGDSEKIRFEVAVGSVMATPHGAQARVTTSTDGGYTSSFSDGDEIGVYIVKGGGGLQSSGNWVDNMKMTYNNGSWTPVFPLGKEYYPTDGDKLSFYAYYPYNSAVTNARNMDIPGLTDQSTAENFAKSDLLCASTPFVGKSTTPVRLEFSHTKAMVELSVTDGGAGAQMSSEVVVTLEGCVPSTSFNLLTGAAKASGFVQSIRMCRVEQPTDDNYLTSYTYRALVPNQLALPKPELFRFSQTQGDITRTLSHKPSSNVPLYAQQVKHYDITLQPSIDANHVYAVGDYYPYKGLPILGVVFETNNGGVNGKIVDLDYIQSNPEAPIRWGDPTVDEQANGVASIRDHNDGYTATKNLINKRKDQSNFADVYCVFNWIYQTKNNGNVDGMWYLPAVNELKTIIPLKSTINPIIQVPESRNRRGWQVPAA